MICSRGLVLEALVCISLSAAMSQQHRDITVEWMYGDTAAMISALPSRIWLKDGTILLLDPQKPAAERGFEVLDPRSGARTPALDTKKALGSLRNLFPGDSTLSDLSWPSSLDAAGKRAAYIFSGDVAVLDFSSGMFEQITQTPSEERAVTISPDGNRVAFVRDNDLYVYDLLQRRERRITQDGCDSVLNGVFSWVYWEEIFGHKEVASWWSPDSRSIAFLRTDESHVGTTCFTDFQPYLPRVIRQRYPQAGQRNPAVTLGIADARSGEVTWMHVPPASYEYLLRVDWLPGSDRVSVQTMNRAQTEVTLSFVDRSTGATRDILQETDDAWLHHYRPFFSHDGTYFIWLSERTGYAHAYRYDMSGTLINQITKGEWSLQPRGAFSIYDDSPVAGVDEQKRIVFFTAGEKSSTERHLYRVSLDGTGLERLSKEDGFHLPQFSGDGRYYLDEYSNASVPPKLVLLRSDGTRLQTVSDSRSDLIAPYAMQYPSFFTIPAEDRFSLPAQISKPVDFDPAKKYPVIIYVYGGPGAPSVNNRWNSNEWSESIYFDQVLLRNGFLVMSVDNRSSASIGKIFEKSIKGQGYGDVELHDLMSAVKWLKAQSFVDPDRVGIWGWSGGGMYTLLALTHTKEFRAGIAVAPVTDWHYYDTKWTELVMKRPEDNPEGYRKTSLVNAAPELHGRLLLVHGTYDDNVHPQNSQAFMNELIKADIPFDLMVYPMRKHTIDDAPAKIHLFRTMLEFWKRNL